MGHNKDYWERIRRTFIPKLGLIAQFLEDATGRDIYVTAETHNNQFVGRVNMDEEPFEEWLHERGFERNPLAALKNIGDKIEEGSWRKVGYQDHPKMQLHLILYNGDDIDISQSGYTYVYAHWEYRWDTNPIKHYRSVEMNPGEGVRRMKNLLDEDGIPYEPIRP